MSLIKSSLERAARTRWVMPLIVALAIVVMAINESSYRHSSSSLKQGIALTDARMQAARTLQALTDAETAARAFIASGNPGDLANYRAAVRDMAIVRPGAFEWLVLLDPQRKASIDTVRQRVVERNAMLALWVEMTEKGQNTQAQVLASGEHGRQLYADLREEFDGVLERASAIQGKARTSLRDAILINRVALHGLVLISLLALGLFMRQIRESDERKAQDAARKAEENERLAQQVALRTTALRNLAGHHVNAREDERGRVARELHDEMGGLLTAMKLELARLRRVPDLPDAAKDRLAGLDQRVNEGIAVKRRIIEHLRPSSLDQLGLVPALEMLCQEAAGRLGIPVHTQFSPVALCKDSELTVYRLVQESLTNVSKYAQAREVWVTLEQAGDTVRVTVRDDGRGFDVDDVPAGHHGLLGMRVRVESHAGQLHIASAAGQGTRVEAELPARPPEPTDPPPA
jgi:signal transduction histidine kinase